LDIKTLCGTKEDIAALSDVRCPSVIALGNFDGLHKGHIALFERAKKLSVERGAIFAVFTFADHKLPHITDRADKISIIKNCGADLLCFASFERFKGMSAVSFAEYLLDVLSCEIAVCGRNYRFGREAEGNVSLLQKVFIDHGAGVVIVDDINNSRGELISSSAIKNALSEGNTEEANEMLGRPFSFNLSVVHGKALAGKLGMPTANGIIEGDKFCPRFGVYASKTIVGGRVYPSITNVGVRPTFADGSVCTETHIFDFNSDIYDEQLKVELLSFLRDERKFLGSKELFEQISDDIEAARRYHKN